MLIKNYFSRAFEYVILITILATCVCLALGTPYPSDDSDRMNEILVSIYINN